MKFEEKTVVQIPWFEVGIAVSEEISKLLGHSVVCEVVVDDEFYWTVRFTGYRMPMYEFYFLLGRAEATAEEISDSMTEDDLDDMDSIGMELSLKLLTSHLHLKCEKTMITSETLWLVLSTEPKEKTPLKLKIGDLELDLQELKSKQELLSYFQENGASHAALMDFCEEYRDKYGNELCWPYPISEGKHLGTFILPVKEGILSIPYDDANKPDYELFCVDDISFFDFDSIDIFITDWNFFNHDLLQAMYAIKHYLQKQEEEHESKN